MPVPEWRLELGDGVEMLKGLSDASVDLILTDPPYGHNNNEGDLNASLEAAMGQRQKKEVRPILNDGKEDADGLYRAVLGEARRVLVKGGNLCVCCGGGGGVDPTFARWSHWMDEAMEFKQAVVWDKCQMGIGWHYRRTYEFVLVGTKPGAACKWHDDSGAIENIVRIQKISPNQLQHPNEKPAELMKFFIKVHTLPGDLVVDPFAGIATTGYAALRLERRFIGAELDPEFHAKGLARMEAESRQGRLF